MFTGLIEDLGIILKMTKNTIEISTVLDDINIGDSLSLNGVCLTVVSIKSGSSNYNIILDVMPETWNKSNLKKLKIKEKVNLERALTLKDRLGGHIVSGHVEDIGSIKSIKKDKNAWLFTVNTKNRNLLLNIFDKASIALDGISLTVVKKTGTWFVVSVIPETFRKTNFQFKRAGSILNIETDYLTKNIERKNESKISYKLLKEKGFL